MKTSNKKPNTIHHENTNRAQFFASNKIFPKPQLNSLENKPEYENESNSEHIMTMADKVLAGSSTGNNSDNRNSNAKNSFQNSAGLIQRQKAKQSKNMLSKTPTGFIQLTPESGGTTTLSGPGQSALESRNNAIVSRQNGPNSVEVSYGERNFTVQRRLSGFREVTRTVHGDPPALTAGGDRNNVWLQVSWCEHQRHRGQIRLGADVPAAATRFLRNVGSALLSGSSPSEAITNFDINAFLSLELQFQNALRLRARGTTQVQDPTQPRVPSAGAHLDLEIDNSPVNPYVEYQYEQIPSPIPGGESRPNHTFGVGVSIPFPWERQSTEVECSSREVVEYVPEYTYECVEHIPESSTTSEKKQWIYFEYATNVIATHNSATGRRRRAENEVAATQNDQSLTRIRALINQGYQITQIEGFTSPEGPRQQIREGGFQGNQTLSLDRATAARTFIENFCNTNNLSNCFAQGMSVSGSGELPTLNNPQSGQELEGSDLINETTTYFTGSEAEASRRTPALEQQLQGAGEETRASLIYPLLRRAEISFSHTERHPARDENMETCPSAVQNAARDYLE